MIGWGSTYGPIGAACRRVRSNGGTVAQIHLRHLNPLPKNLGEVLRRYERVLVPEMNLGQLRMLLRDRYLVDARGHNRVTGMPFKVEDLEVVINKELDELGSRHSPWPDHSAGDPYPVTGPNGTAAGHTIEEVSK